MTVGVVSAQLSGPHRSPVHSRAQVRRSGGPVRRPSRWPCWPCFSPYCPGHCARTGGPEVRSPTSVTSVPPTGRAVSSKPSPTPVTTREARCVPRWPRTAGSRSASTSGSASACSPTAPARYCCLPPCFSADPNPARGGLVCPTLLFRRTTSNTGTSPVPGSSTGPDSAEPTTPCGSGLPCTCRRSYSASRWSWQSPWRSTRGWASPSGSPPHCGRPPGCSPSTVLPKHCWPATYCTCTAHSPPNSPPWPPYGARSRPGPEWTEAGTSCGSRTATT